MDGDDFLGDPPMIEEDKTGLRWCCILSAGMSRFGEMGSRSDGLIS